MTRFLSGAGVILALELRQRVRGPAWSILLTVFVGLIAIVTALLTLALGGFGASSAGGGVFSAIIYFVLLLGTLVAPALSGNAINGDREAGTLATTQITLVTTGQIVVGKFLAAWITALAFLAAAVPFLIFCAFVGGLSAVSVVVSTLALALELGIIAAIGVGLSGLIQRGLFSIVTTYLAVAALSIGTLIAFGLGGLAVQSTGTYTSSFASPTDSDGTLDQCETTTSTTRVPRFDYFWGFLVANPYVVLADIVPATYDGRGAPTDLFGFVKVGVRSAQIAPDLDQMYDECEDGLTTPLPEQPTARDIIESTIPGWAVGLLIQFVLAAGALVAAWGSLRTPARRLARGSRIA